MDRVRLCLRLARLAVPMGWGFAVAALLPLAPRPVRLAMAQLWARTVLAALGVRVHLEGTPPATHGLIVANHVSWLDVLVIAAVCRAEFVCKEEVARWPGIGWLAARAGTIFIRRRDARQVHAATARVAERLASAHVAVFPEGTTTDGNGVLPFRGAFFESAIALGRPIHPIAIEYSAPTAAYAGDTAFLESLVAVAGSRALAVRVCAQPSIPSGALTRREAARLARQAIVSSIGNRTVAGTSSPSPTLRAACASRWLPRLIRPRSTGSPARSG